MIASSALVLALAVSCEREPQGKGDATIGFAKETYVYKESAGLVKIPIQFTGEPKTYPITFDIVAEVEGTEFEVEDLVHFTQTKGLKYAGIENVSAYLEFQVFDNQEINESRFINISIENVSGATLAGTGKAVIELADNDNNPYERLMGNWVFSAKKLSDDSAASFEVNISGGFSADEESVNYEKTLVCWGFNGYKEDLSGSSYVPDHQPLWYMAYNADEETLAVLPDKLLANIFNFSLEGYKSFELKSVTIPDGDEDFSFTERIYATWSDDMNTITFKEGDAFGAYIFGDGQDTGYYWTGFYDIVMTRK